MRRDVVSRLEAAVRDANPVPHVDDLIDSDEATAVTRLVEQRRRTMTATPTKTAPRPTGPPPHRRPSMAWAFAAGFVVILLVVGAAALFLRGGDTPVADEPAPEPTVTTSEVATTAAAETPTDLIRVGSLTWSRVPHDEAVFGIDGPAGLMSIEGSLDLRGAVEVIEGGPGLVAVGGHGDDAAVWTSTDGIAWSRVPHDEAVFGGEGHSAAVSVTTGGPGLVAVGFTRFPDDSSGVVWTSPDGLTWSRTWSRVPFADDEADHGLWAFMTVTEGGPGLVAVGHTGSTRHAFISPDGITWTAAGGLAGGGWVHDVTAGGPGLIAVGSGTGQSDSEDAAVWTSQDGVSWSRIPHDEALSGAALCETASILNVEHPEWNSAVMTGITAGGPGFVAVGDVVCGDQGADPETGRGAVVWTSQDGITWSRVPYDDAIFGGAGMRDVIAVGDGLVAVGVNHSRDGAVVWTSQDGIIWDRIPYDADVFGGLAGMSSVTDSGPGLVAVGADEEGTVVWTATAGD